MYSHNATKINSPRDSTLPSNELSSGRSFYILFRLDRHTKRRCSKPETAILTMIAQVFAAWTDTWEHHVPARRQAL